MYPVWDASGKYLWFLASTDFGLASQWLDMTSYGREETFALYLAVLKKTEPSPLLPESDEDPGVGDAARATRAAEQAGDAAPRRRSVQIDFDRLQQRILPVTGVPSRQYSQLQGRRRRHGVLPRSAEQPRARAATSLHRFRLSDRKPRAVPDRRRRIRGQRRRQEAGLSHRRRRRRPNAPAARRRRGRRCSSSMPTRSAPTGGRRAVSTSTLRMNLDPKAEFTQIFNEGWRLQRDYLYVPNMHGTNWPRMKEMYGADAAARHAPRRSQLPARQHGRRDRDRPLVRARRRDAGSAGESPGGLLGADFTIENSRYKIAQIYDGESWNPELRAPLRRPASTSTVGDFILAINGVNLTAPDNIYRLLDGTANRQTVLTVNTRPDAAGRAAGHGRARGERTGAAHARVGRREPPLRRQAIERPARVRLRAEHGPGRLRRASTATTSRSRTSRAR